MSQGRAAVAAVFGALLGACFPGTAAVVYNSYFATLKKQAETPTAHGFELFALLALLLAGCGLLLLGGLAAALAAYGAHGAARWGIRLSHRPSLCRYGVMLLCAFGPVLVVALLILPVTRPFEFEGVFIAHVGLSAFFAAAGVLEVDRMNQTAVTAPPRTSKFIPAIKALRVTAKHRLAAAAVSFRNDIDKLTFRTRAVMTTSVCMVLIGWFLLASPFFPITAEPSSILATLGLSFALFLGSTLGAYFLQFSESTVARRTSRAVVAFAALGAALEVLFLLRFIRI